MLYEAVLSNPSFPISERAHYFYGTAAKQAQGPSKKLYRYGPFVPGTLKSSIYQVWSQSKSDKAQQTYEVSWNRTKAPYGHMVEMGTSKAPAHPFIGAAAGAQPKAVQAMAAKFDERLTKAGVL